MAGLLFAPILFNFLDVSPASHVNHYVHGVTYMCVRLLCLNTAGGQYEDAVSLILNHEMADAAVQ